MWENVDRKSPDFATVNSSIESIPLEEVLPVQKPVADFLPGAAKCCGRGSSVPPAAASSASAEKVDV